MAGHSHWKNIKRTKDSDSKKRSLLFSKTAKILTLLAREGGSDPENNPALKSAIEKAKQDNIPKENIERAVKKGSGETKGNQLERFTFEAYGPEGVALIAEGITDNLNRSLAEFKKIVLKYNGKIAESGSVKWLFDRINQIEIDIKNFSEVELDLIDAGALDIIKESDRAIILFNADSISQMKSVLKEKSVPLLSSYLFWKPKNEISLNKELKNKAFSLLYELEDSEDIQDLFSNLSKE